MRRARRGPVDFEARNSRRGAVPAGSARSARPRRISYEEYYPYGATAWWAQDSSIDVSLKRYRYTGMERDEETGLASHGVRMYAAWLGRWTSADPSGLKGGINRYAYCRGSPIGLKDIDGRKPQERDEPAIALQLERITAEGLANPTTPATAALAELQLQLAGQTPEGANPDSASLPEDLYVATIKVASLDQVSAKQLRRGLQGAGFDPNLAQDAGNKLDFAKEAVGRGIAGITLSLSTGSGANATLILVRDSGDPAATKRTYKHEGTHAASEPTRLESSRLLDEAATEFYAGTGGGRSGYGEIAQTIWAPLAERDPKAAWQAYFKGGTKAIAALGRSVNALGGDPNKTLEGLGIGTRVSSNWAALQAIGQAWEQTADKETRDKLEGAARDIILHGTAQ